ncbi:MAG TPA: M23 family metallopeptidase [Bryobacteraceae bacterium]|jgi:murein DD-endopeptidase MepM/ murein hydrolase activator NlpD|nr:M23 family metallopeptidase [Bryobacteraceae bacterium]
MNQQYFVVEFAHSVHGHVKRVEVSYRLLAYTGSVLALLSLIMAGLCSSYVHMSWQVSNYNELRANFDHLRTRYQELQRVSRQHADQMATLENLASEVSVAYGLKPPARQADPNGLASANSLTPTLKQSIEQYNFLASASYSSIYHRYPYQWQVHSLPSLWPVHGVVRSAFGDRSDPFSGEGAFHTGIDLQAAAGTPVHVTADGVVASVGWEAGYGKLVVVDHGNGVETYYAHLSQFMVAPGEEVRMGQVIALSGGTGRATSPHLHYEVRLHGIPVNPYKYLAKSQISLPTKPSHNDLGL